MRFIDSLFFRLILILRKERRYEHEKIPKKKREGYIGGG
jgi:hypothetical protein